MALREEFETSGQWLFRWRSYLPLISVVIFILAIVEFAVSGSGAMAFIDLWICLAVALFGLAIRGFTIGHTPKGTSGRNTKTQVADVLNTTGIYSVVRNPLYVGNYFMGLGVALYPGLWYLVLIYSFIFWLYYERIIFAEEAFLRDKFGSDYLDWAARTPVFIPRLGQYERANLPFSWKNVLRREYNGFFAPIFALLLLELARTGITTGDVALSEEWQMVLGVSFAIWFVLRAMKRHTKILDVAGR